MTRLYIALIVIIFFSCEETILLDIDQTPSQVVIEGLVTDNQLFNYVKISRSVDFYEQDLIPLVKDAIVTVTDNEGGIFVFDHNPRMDEDSIGYYKSVSGFIGKVGNIYTLEVDLDGQIYTAIDSLLPVTEIDSLAIQIDEDERLDSEEPGEFYNVLFYAKEPKDRLDFYFFRFLRNGKIHQDFEGDIYFTDDRVLGEGITSLPVPGYFALSDTVQVEMYSISREGFIFYEDLINLINNDGGMFSAPPTNARTNLDNNALGFFQVSSMRMETIIVE